MTLGEKQIETSAGYKGPHGEKPLEFVGGVCHSDLSHCSSPCMTAIVNDNESELIYGMVILITAWTEFKTLCE